MVASQSYLSQAVPALDQFFGFTSRDNREQNNNYTISTQYEYSGVALPSLQPLQFGIVHCSHPQSFLPTKPGHQNGQLMVVRTKI